MKFALFIVNNEEDVWHVFLNYYLIKPRRLTTVFRKLFIRLKNLGNRNSDYILVEFERAASNSIQNFNHSFNRQPFTNTTLRWLAWLIGFYGRIFYNLIIIINTARKVSNYGVFSGPYFPLLRLNTGKYGPEKTPYLDAFHVVQLMQNPIPKSEQSSIIFEKPGYLSEKLKTLRSSNYHA